MDVTSVSYTLPESSADQIKYSSNFGRYRNHLPRPTHHQMNFPEDLRYTSEHEWIRLTDETTSDGRPIAVIGITDFAQSELGELVYIEVETIGENLNKDEIFGTVEAVKTTSDLFMPISGEVLEFNEAISESGGDDPSLINNDPYGRGWIIKVAPSDLEEIQTLMGAAAYKELTGH
jgi:glycine cleavage system H protein